MNFFSKFPTIKYKVNSEEYEAIDITRRAKILSSVRSDPYALLPYTISHDDKPEDVAFLYYGSVGYTWLVYLANQIIDPYTQWPKSSEKFANYVIEKYKVQADDVDYAVLAWAQTNTKHYKNIANNDILISTDTYTYNDKIAAEEWTSVSYYDYETEENDNLRSINLVNKAYADTMQKEYTKLINGK